MNATIYFPSKWTRKERLKWFWDRINPKAIRYYKLLKDNGHRIIGG